MLTSSQSRYWAYTPPDPGVPRPSHSLILCWPFRGVEIPELGREWSTLRRLSCDLGLTVNAVTDAWIAAAVRRIGSHLITFDKGYSLQERSWRVRVTINCAARSTSSSVVWRPRVRRTAPAATFASTFIAASTGEIRTPPS